MVKAFNYEKQEKKNKSSRRRKKTCKRTSRRYQNTKNVKKIIQKAAKSPISKKDINECLKNVSNFLGVYAADELKFCPVVKNPVFLIVNLDPQSEAGSHWISLRISDKEVEIFDSLGFNPHSWGFYPKLIFQFLSNFKYSHNFKISPVLQPPNTFSCGVFAIYFVLKRQNCTFANCTRIFSPILSENFNILCDVLQK